MAHPVNVPAVNMSASTSQAIASDVAAATRLANRLCVHADSRALEQDPEGKSVVDAMLLGVFMAIVDVFAKKVRSGGVPLSAQRTNICYS